MKECSQCGTTKPFEDFARAAAGKDGRRAECKLCQAAKRPLKECDTCGETKRLHDRFRKTGGGRSSTCKSCERKHKRRCRTCRRVLALGEPDCCATFQLREKLPVTAPGTGRPGCIVRDGKAWVPDAELEDWVPHEIKFCSICGVDQHLDECLDCTSPVSTSKRTPINPLKPCIDCGAWSPTERCWECKRPEVSSYHD